MRQWQRPGKGIHDLAHHFVLQHEYISQIAVEPVRPEMASAQRLDELGVDSYSRRRPPDAAFDDVANAKLLGDRADIDRPALVGKARIARDDQKTAHFR